MHTLTPPPPIRRINACVNLQGADTNPDGHHAMHKTAAQPPENPRCFFRAERAQSKTKAGISAPELSATARIRAISTRFLESWPPRSGRRQAACEQVSQIKHQATLQKQLSTLLSPRPEHQEEGCDPCTQAPLGEPSPLPRLLPAPGVLIKWSDENHTVCARVVVYHRKNPSPAKPEGLLQDQMHSPLQVAPLSGFTIQFLRAAAINREGILPGIASTK